ncbi:phage tail assembly protein [Methylosinus sp. Sm6]|uniref:phage tail assembly protein n=1 Tax=Methylosinus sp. Sm6 TaxID=2866948 RepID=UPI001C997DA2|nr:phage tail assembly protein [Methylosinus sp. Sm6]MBY6244127.1 phage tail assembly protein [Methylosinus sp. Sm6]
METPVNLDNGEKWGVETIPIAHPFTLKGVTYSGVALRVPAGVDVMRFYEGSPRPSLVDFAVGLLQNADGAPLDKLVLSAMHGTDTARIVAKASAFLGDAR